MRGWPSSSIGENEAVYNLTRFAQDMLSEFEMIDEHGYQGERFELARAYIRNANSPMQFRRLRPFLVRLRADISASENEGAEQQLEAIKRWVTQIDRVRKVRK